MTAFKIVTGAAALWSALMVFASDREHHDVDPPRAVPMQLRMLAEEGDQFTERWQPVSAAALLEAMRKGTPEPQRLATATEADLNQAREEHAPRIKRRHKVKRDICENGRRYFYRGRHKYWRCRR